MENMMIILRSCHESWHNYDHDHVRYDHGAIMAWQSCFFNPGKTSDFFSQNFIESCFHKISIVFKSSSTKMLILTQCFT